MKTFKYFKKYVLLIALVGILAITLGCPTEAVTPIINVTGISVTGAAEATEVSNNETLQMSASVLPIDATDMSVTWSVVNGTGAASISESGLLTATSVGTVNVKATANDDSNIIGELEITVTAANTMVSITAVGGVTVPVRNVTPDMSVTANEEFTGTIVWEPSDSPFAASTVYTATITLTAEPGYTFSGVAADSFTVAGADSTNAINSGVVTAVFSATEAAPDVVVTTTAITGVTVPVTGEIPVTSIISNDQYTGTVAWDPLGSPFAELTAYTATITLTAEPGYTLTGVAADSFIVAGATSHNTLNSGVVTAIFPATEAGPDVAISNSTIAGVTVPVTGETPVISITADEQFTGTVVWDPSSSPFAASTVYTATITLTAETGYTFTGVAANSFIVAGATTTNAIDSGVVVATFPATEAGPDVAISNSTIAGVTVPVTGQTPVTSITADEQFTGTVVWDPSGSPFAASTSYTATITLTAETGYTLTGVAADSFIVAGATTTNAINSGVITAVFPATEPIEVSIMAIPGVTAPVRGEIPDLIVTSNEQYTGTVEWDPLGSPFAASTAYTATITLTAETGYTFTGVAANSFTVAGSTNVTNAIDSGVVTAVFPETTIAPLARVELGTAANYAILAETLISTTGTTAITGDLGLSPYATTFITGFALTDATGYATSSLVDGKIYAADMAPPTPDNLITAVSNMETAFTDAAGRITPDELNLGSGAIGGLTLAPGLYKWSGTVEIGANLTLNGSADDIWIFQVANDLNLANDFDVVLTGGALAENVFWQVSGIATLGTGSHMEGIILSQTQIILNTGSSINGRLLAQTQVTLDAATVVEPVIL